MQTGDPLVSAEWLKTNIDAPDVRVIDASWFAPFVSPVKSGKKIYDAGHIPGAVFFDIDDISDTDSPFPHTAPDAIKFSSRVRKLGIGDGHRIIVYDQNNFCASARAWWILRLMGHDEVAVLDGGMAAWQAIGGEVEDIPAIVTERHFTARVQSNLIKTTAQVEQAVKTASHRIVDARPLGRFLGTDPEPREGLPSGHIPGSSSLPASDLVNPDGTLKSVEQLSNHLENPEQATITTCGSGVTACILALALARLGNWDVAVYDGSWSEWASDPTREIAQGKA
ncbi:MAG: sulfurtransferase [Hyphomonas sp.]